MAELSGSDDVFVVKNIAFDFLIIRSDQTFNHILIDLKNVKSIELYRLLADEKEKSTIADWSSMGDLSYPGDGITFDKRDGNKLYFKHKDLFGNKESTLIYVLEGASGASKTFPPEN